jgi:hypothetical protein
MLQTHRSLKAYCATLWWRWRERWSVFFHFFQVMEHRWNEIVRGKPKYSGKKPVPVPLCPPQIPHGLTRDQTAVWGCKLTAWAMARPRKYSVFITNLACIWWWVVSFDHFMPQRNNIRYSVSGAQGWSGYWVLDASRKRQIYCSCWESKHDSSVVRPVA